MQAAKTNPAKYCGAGFFAFAVRVVYRSKTPPPEIVETGYENFFAKVNPFSTRYYSILFFKKQLINYELLTKFFRSIQIPLVI